jgi:DNA-binding MarR family transcriptional regulator
MQPNARPGKRGRSAPKGRPAAAPITGVGGDSSERAALVASLRAMRKAMARDFMASAIAALDHSDLSMVQMATLMLLDSCDELPVRALAERLGRSLSATSRLLDQLVRRRLLWRAIDKDDRRVRRVGLAARGRALVEQLMSDRADAQLRIMQQLTARQRAQVRRAMQILQDAAERKFSDE